MANSKRNIRTLTLPEMSSYFQSIGEAAFRAKQLHEWLWQKSARSFSEMSNLSVQLRKQLEEEFTLPSVSVAEEQFSADKTIKTAFQLADGKITEGVLIPTNKRMTACISSQIGCSLSCKFCATGKLKLMRNIQFDEIYDQVAIIKEQAEKHYQKGLTNIVYMGMGEPLLNYSQLLKSVERITAVDGLGMSPKRITVSTAGIAKLIKRLGDDDTKFNLALSLHAANDDKRSKIMPINEQNNLSSLTEALGYYYEKTGNRFTLEYIIFKDFNDELQDAQELTDFASKLPCKINLIEYNPIDEGSFQQADPIKVDQFADYLESKNLIVNLRRSRGKDIDAACGQLANKNAAVAT